MAERKLFKNTNDFIIGVVLLVLGIYVLFTDDIVQGNFVANAGGPLVRPDVYVRLIGGFLAFFAAILTLKSINFSRSAETKSFHFNLNPEVVLTMVSLIIYTILLTRIGFAISTFLLVFFLTCMYMRKETTGEGKPPLTRKGLVKTLIIILVYSLLLVLFVYYIFSRVLYVVLP